MSVKDLRKELFVFCVMFCSLFLYALPVPPAYISGAFVEAPIDIEELKKSAKAGDPEAQGILSSLFRRGECGLKKNYPEAFKWAELSAAKGNAFGLYNLAVMYRYGLDAGKNAEKAAEFYRRALPELEKLARLGDSRALYDLGYMYFTGEGLEKDTTKALKFFRESAKRRNPSALYMLAYIYDTGSGVSKDPKEAARWYLKSAKTGNDVSQYRLGVLLLNHGVRVKRSNPEALRWLLMSAAQNNTDAQFALGYMYEFGDGVEKDFSKADKWYRRAALRGNEKAINRLKTLAEIFRKLQEFEKNKNNGKNGKKQNEKKNI